VFTNVPRILTHTETRDWSTGRYGSNVYQPAVGWLSGGHAYLTWKGRTLDSGICETQAKRWDLSKYRYLLGRVCHVRNFPLSDASKFAIHHFCANVSQAMGPFQICGCPFHEPGVSEIAHTHIYIYHLYIYRYTHKNIDIHIYIYIIFIYICILTYMIWYI